MTNPYYVPSGTPGTGAPGASQPMRTEFNSVAAGFDLLPAFSPVNAAVVVNAGGTALTTTTGALVLSAGFTLSGGFAVTLSASAAVTLTLPAVAGTLATLAGTETLSNKTLVAPLLGTPTSGVLTNCTGLPIATGVAGLGVGVATFLASPTADNLRNAVTGTTGSSNLVFGTSPTLVTPLLGTPASGVLTNCTGLPEAGLALTDITTNNATSVKHGFLPKLSGVSTEFLNGVGAFSSATLGPYNEIDSHTVSGTEATISLAGLTYEDILIVVDGIVGDQASQHLFMKVSIDGGSTFTTTGIPVADSASVTTSARYYTISATGAKTGYLSFVAGAPSATAPGINSRGYTTGTGSLVAGGNFTAGAQITNLQFLPSNGNFTAGTITVYGKN